MPSPPRPSPGCLRTLVAPNASPHTLDGTNTYLLGVRRVVVVDPGPDDPVHLGRIADGARGGGGEVVLILVTHAHADHLGGARRLASLTGAPVGRWRAGDRPLADGDVVAEGSVRLRVVHTPGHSPDHVAFAWDGQRTLFSGDLVLGRGTVTVSPPAGSMSDYLGSLERVARLDLAVIAPGHGPMVQDPGARLAEYLAHRRMRERQVLAAVAAGLGTPRQIASALYPALDPRLRSAARATVLAHLVKLEREGRVARAGNRYAVPRGKRGERGGSDGGAADADERGE